MRLKRRPGEPRVAEPLRLDHAGQRLGRHRVAMRHELPGLAQRLLRLRQGSASPKRAASSPKTAAAPSRLAAARPPSAPPRRMIRRRPPPRRSDSTSRSPASPTPPSRGSRPAPPQTGEARRHARRLLGRQHLEDDGPRPSASDRDRLMRVVHRIVVDLAQDHDVGGGQIIEVDRLDLPRPPRDATSAARIAAPALGRTRRLRRRIRAPRRTASRGSGASWRRPPPRAGAPAPSTGPAPRRGFPASAARRAACARAR
jgi:hypothetical protein